MSNESKNIKEIENEKKYLSRFSVFFNSEKLSSTYKPVFLKSLIPVSFYDKDSLQRLMGQQWITTNEKEMKIDLNFIALRYIRFYWELYSKFKLRQSHSPQDANINKILQNVIADSKVPTLQALVGQNYSILRSDVIKNSIKREVLIHLDNKKELYEYTSRENFITINYSLVRFFTKYRDILIPGLNYTITRYLEKINFAPRIAEKVSGYIPRSYLTDEEKRIILELNNKCFYCKEKPGICMDHVIPFNFIYQTEVFNMVPACQECNSVKNDTLPTQELFELVKGRNSKLLLRQDYTDDWYQKLYDNCATNYQGHRPYFSPYN